MFVHQCQEAVFVPTLQQMDHLVHHDVLEAQRRFLGELEIDLDVPHFDVARFPARSHLANTPGGDIDSKGRNSTASYSQS